MNFTAWPSAAVRCSPRSATAPVVHSPLVEDGAAQVLGSLERIESLRWANYLAPDGLAVVSSQVVLPITVSSGQAKYPEDAQARIRAAFPRLIYLDAVGMATEVGNARCSNLVILGRHFHRPHAPGPGLAGSYPPVRKAEICGPQPPRLRRRSGTRWTKVNNGPTSFVISPILPAEIPGLLTLIGELARFERLEDEVQATVQSLHDSFFGPQPVAGALLARQGVELAGYAIYFFTFSSFVGRRGLWLEDVYVRPAFRRQGRAAPCSSGLPAWPRSATVAVWSGPR